jgi:dTDP-4-dehydrorhamnose 3,5-epimerase
MEFRERKLKGVFEITLNPHRDPRGFFMRTFDDERFAAAGLGRKWVQENHSQSLVKGTIRGLHFQFPPFTETKLVRCTRGSILDVFVDLREGSETFGGWDSIVLSESNFTMIFIPPGFAHGFCTLENQCDVMYKVDNWYNRDAEAGLFWNDSELAIQWPVSEPTLSEKDSRNITLSEFRSKYGAIRL